MQCVGIMLVSRKGIKQPTEEVSTQLLRTLDFDVNEWMTSVPSKCHTIEPNPLWNRQIRQFHEIFFPWIFNIHKKDQTKIALGAKFSKKATKSWQNLPVLIWHCSRGEYPECTFFHYSIKKFDIFFIKSRTFM